MNATPCHDIQYEGAILLFHRPSPVSLALSLG
jgi:hypothetical protein